MKKKKGSNRKGSRKAQPGGQSKAELLDQQYQELMTMLSGKGVTAFQLTEIQRVVSDKAAAKQLQDLNKTLNKEFTSMEEFTKSYRSAEPNAALNNAIKEFTRQYPGKPFTVDADGRPKLYVAADDDGSGGGEGEEDDAGTGGKSPVQIKIDNQNLFLANPDLKLIEAELQAMAQNGQSLADVYYENPEAFASDLKLAKIEQEKSDDDAASNKQNHSDQEQDEDKSRHREDDDDEESDDEDDEDHDEDEDEDEADDDGIYQPPTSTWGRVVQQ